MAKKKKDIKIDNTDPDDVSDLLELAQQVNLPDGFFDGDVQDECESDAKILAKKINSGTLMEQLEFLIEHGYQKGRLEELIRENE